MKDGAIIDIDKDEEWKTELNEWYSVRLEI
jgi:hypothetical protein